MDQAASTLTLAELADTAAGHVATDAATPADIGDLRHYLADELAALTADWHDRPDAPLRVTKRRLRTMSICPAQILTELDDVPLNHSLAAGVIGDLAAGLVAVNPRFPAEQGWLNALRRAIEAERPDVAEFVDGLDGDDREEFETLIDERCSVLPHLLGDLSGHRPHSHERVTVRFLDANVWLTAELDLAVGEPRVVAEVKVGSYTNWIPEELRHYGLVVALRDGRAPIVGAAVTLADQRVSAVALGLDELELAAKRVLGTVADLVAVDRATTDDEPLPTRPGGHCRWCPRVEVCDAPDDMVRAELEAEALP